MIAKAQTLPTLAHFNAVMIINTSLSLFSTLLLFAKPRLLHITTRYIPRDWEWELDY